MLRHLPALAVLTLLVGGAAPNALAGESADALAARLANSGRPEADVARDEGRKPAEVLTFAGIGEGMTVLDVIAASGWYTEVLSVAVGKDGKVYAQNTAFTLQIRDGANDKAMTARLAGGRLPNVVRLDRELDDLGIEPGSVDAAITALNFHDIYNSSGPEAAVGFLNAVAKVLKPGGRFVVIDHVGGASAPNADLHRMTEAQARQAIEASVLVLASESDLLRNPADDHTKRVFDPSIRGHTDRFLYVLRKPE